MRRGVRGRGYGLPVKEGGSLSQISGMAYKLLFYLAAYTFTISNGIGVKDGNMSSGGMIPLINAAGAGLSNMGRRNFGMGKRISSGINPLPKIGIVIGKAVAKMVASVSNGFRVMTPCSGTALIFSCIKCRPGRISLGKRQVMGIGVIRSTGTLRRIIIMKCAARQGTAVAKSMTAVAAGSLGRDPATGLAGTLTKHVPNLVTGRFDKNRPNISKTSLHVHKTSACKSRAPVFVVSNIRHSSVTCLTPRRVRAFAVLGSTSTATTCKVHKTGNMIMVAAGHKRTSRGPSIDFGTSIKAGSPTGFPRCLNSTRCTRLCGRTHVGVKMSPSSPSLFSAGIVRSFGGKGKCG